MSGNLQSDTRDPHRWTMRFSISLSCIIAAFGTWGWLTHYRIIPPDFAVVAGGCLMAGVCLVAQGMCNNMAVEARRARAHGFGWSFHAATLVALGFGGVSAMGLHHGWEIARSIAPEVEIATVPDWLMTSFFVFLAMGEPASFWIVEVVRNGRGGGPDRCNVDHDHDQTEQNSGRGGRDLRGAAWSPRVVEMDSGAAQPNRRNRSPVRTAGLVAATAAALVAGGSCPVEPVVATMPAQMATAAGQVDHQDVVARVRALSAEGWSERRIALEIGITRHSARRLLGRA